MTKICFATQNRNKIQEVQALLEGQFQLVSLAELGCTRELAEDQDSLEGNSLQKAKYIWDTYQVSCFADDSGLEVEALGGAPGVHSAHYAGPQRSYQDNVLLLLTNMQGQSNRKAKFRTCITLVLNGEVHQFEGIIHGHILEAPRGSKGFGYDPVFVPEGYGLTFAEMELEEKNRISHRSKAVEALVEFLRH